MMAQPILQEPPQAFSHSTNYWRNPTSNYDYENPADIEVCRETKKDFTEARDHLIHVKETLLDKIDCGGNTNCTKIIVSSVGRSLIRHPPRYDFDRKI